MDKNELYHYGVLGMKWGVRRSKTGYRSTSIKSAIARRQNDTVDASFNDWKKKSKQKADAVELGKKRNEARISYETNKSDKNLKNDYRISNKEYKKALRSNTTYRKGQVKNEVGKDMASKYLSEAKKIKKQMDQNPSDKTLKKKYTSLMNEYDIERARARRAPEVAANRSRKKAAMKRGMTMAVKGAMATAAVGVGVGATNRYLSSKGMKTIDSQDVIKYTKKAKQFMKYV